MLSLAETPTTSAKRVVSKCLAALYELCSFVSSGCAQISQRALLGTVSIKQENMAIEILCNNRNFLSYSSPRRSCLLIGLRRMQSQTVPEELGHTAGLLALLLHLMINDDLFLCVRPAISS